MPFEPHTAHIGSPELYERGQALLSMFTYDAMEHRPTSFLTMKEQPQRHYDTCPLCGFSRVPGGDFTLKHDYKRLGVTLPYLAAHVLAAHGQVGPREVENVRSLHDLLNIGERELGRRIVGITSGAAPEPEFGFVHEQVKGHHHCEQCGDQLNLGTVALTRGSEKLELAYLGLHTLFEHGDPRWVDTDGKSGELDLDAIRGLLDRGEHLAELGERLASILPFLGGTEPPPPGIIVDEHPLRGVEECHRCEARPNMGSFSLVDRRRRKIMALPYIAVHALREHASSHYVGSLHHGTVDVRLLVQMLGGGRPR